jgi:cephalosporin hydroxylase
MDGKTNMKSFNEVWKEIRGRGCTMVQDESELRSICELLGECESYLEVGTAGGNSLYAAGHSLKAPKRIVYVDFCEEHTTPHRMAIIEKLKHEVICSINEIAGNSHSPECVLAAKEKGPYDAVMIDAGHKYKDVMADARDYAPMAKKYVIFHDISLPEVGRAVMHYVAEANVQKFKIFHTHESPFGYGVIYL